MWLRIGGRGCADADQTWCGVRAQLTAQQAAASRSMQYGGQGMSMGGGMGLPMVPGQYPYMQSAYAHQAGMHFGGHFGAPGGGGMQHQPHHAQPPPAYNVPHLPLTPAPRRRLSITNPSTGQAVARPDVGARLVRQRTPPRLSERLWPARVRDSARQAAEARCKRAASKPGGQPGRPSTAPPARQTPPPSRQASEAAKRPPAPGADPDVLCSLHVLPCLPAGVLAPV